MATPAGDSATSYSNSFDPLRPVQAQEWSKEDDYRTALQQQNLNKRAEVTHPTIKHHQESGGQDSVQTHNQDCSHLLQESITEETVIRPNPITASTTTSYSSISLLNPTIIDEEIITTEIERVTPLIQADVDHFPDALGLCIAFSSERGYEKTMEHIPNIRNGGISITDTFRSLGYVTRRIENPSKFELLAVFRAIAKHVKYPEGSYRIVIYCTGHGIENALSLKDGNVDISYLKTLLWKSVAPEISKIPKVLIFECCRGKIDGKSSPSDRTMLPQNHSRAEISTLSAAGNMLVLFSTPLLCRAFGYNSDGVGILTREVVRLLKEPVSQSLAEVFQSKLYTAMERATRGYKQCHYMRPCVESTLEVTINVYEEKIRAMMPTDVKCVEEGEQCRIIWKPPLHSKHHNLQKYKLAKRRTNANSWKRSNIEGGASATCVDVSNREIAGYELSVVACYADSINVPSDTTRLENVDISPRNVSVSEDGEDLTFYWKEPLYSHLFIPTGYIILKKSNNVAGGNWEAASDQMMAEERHCVITSESLEMCSYKVVALYSDREDDGREPQIKQKGPHKKCNRKCAFFLLCMIISSAVIFAAATAFGVEFTKAIPHNNKHLAVAGDVIDCGVPLARYAWFYSGVMVTLDEKKDEEGFQIDFFSIEKSRLKYHKITKVPEPPFIISLNKSSNNRFIIPYDYYNRPWYMRKNSNITLNFDFQNPLQLPTKALAYIINHEENIDDFIAASTPHYEQKIDILHSLNKTLTVTVNDSGYHYIGVEISSDKNVVFMCNITFNIVYIDADDYELQSTNLRLIDRNGQSRSLPLDDKGINLTLCSSQTNIFSPRIHLNIIHKFADEIKALLGILVVLFVLTVLVIIFILCFYCISYCRSTGDYTRLV